MVSRIAFAGFSLLLLAPAARSAGEESPPVPPEQARGAQGHLRFYGRWLGKERPAEADLSKVTDADLIVRGEGRMRSGLFLEASGDFALAILKSPESARAHLLFSHSLLGLSEFRLAGREISLALECDPSIDPSKANPGAAFPDRAFYEERLRALARLFESKPGTPEALLVGFHRLSAGDRDGAFRALGAARREDREYPVVARLLGDAAAAERAKEPARSPAPPARRPDSPKEPSPPPLPPPDPVRESLEKGIEALRAGRWPEAQGMLRASVAGPGASGEALVALGLSLAADGEIRPASAAVATGLSRDPSLAEPRKAALRFGGAVLDKAASRLEGADPTSASTAFLRGFLAAAAGRDGDAARFLRSIPAGQYEFDGARRLLDGIAARAPTPVPEARPATAPAPATDADSTSLKAGDEFFQGGRFEEAMESYRRAAARDPKAAEPLAALSEAAFAAGNFPLAAETLLEAFGRDPAWFDGRFSPRLPIPGRGLEEERRKALRARAAPADLPLRILLALRSIHAGDLDEATTALGGGAADDANQERARRFFLDQVEVFKARAASLRDSQ